LSKEGQNGQLEDIRNELKKKRASETSASRKNVKETVNNGPAENGRSGPKEPKRKKNSFRNGPQKKKTLAPEVKNKIEGCYLPPKKLDRFVLAAFTKCEPGGKKRSKKGNHPKIPELKGCKNRKKPEGWAPKPNGDLSPNEGAHPRGGERRKREISIKREKPDRRSRGGAKFNLAGQNEAGTLWKKKGPKKKTDDVCIEKKRADTIIT